MSDSRWDDVRKVVLARDDYRCRRCLKPAHHVHHRLVKGMGGSSVEDVKYGLANCVSLCAICHDHVHRHPAESYARGWLVHSWDHPEDVLLEPGSVLIRLKADGTVLEKRFDDYKTPGDFFT